MRHRPPRLVFLFIMLVLALVSQTGPALAATSSQNRAGAASGWLARQMTNHSHFVTKFQGKTFPNQGGTIDAVFAFAATGTANQYGARAMTWLERHAILTNYIGNGTTSSFAGATAKVLLAAEVRGVNPAKFGGVNLPARLAKLLTPSGRYSDQSSFGDFSNAFSQALAIIATAMAVQALLAAGRRAAAVRGLRWLASVQLHNGGFAASGATAANANTTGLVGEALAAGRWFGRADRAQRFLLSLQVGCSAKANRGALAFQKTQFKRSTAISATAQGILGLADVSLGKLTSRGSSDVAPHLRCAS
jgi:hypothetical protein